MPTARERMLEISALASGATARLHFLDIKEGTGELVDPVDPTPPQEVIVMETGGLELQADTYTANMQLIATKTADLELATNAASGMELDEGNLDELGLDDDDRSGIALRKC